MLYVTCFQWLKIDFFFFFCRLWQDAENRVYVVKELDRRVEQVLNFFGLVVLSFLSGHFRCNWLGFFCCIKFFLIHLTIYKKFSILELLILNLQCNVRKWHNIHWIAIWCSLAFTFYFGFNFGKTSLDFVLTLIILELN